MKFSLKFKLAGLPEMVVGETDTETPFKAGLMLQDQLKARIGEKKFGSLENATIYDESGKERALLQIDKAYDKATNTFVSKPRWDMWLTIRELFKGNSPAK